MLEALKDINLFKKKEDEKEEESGFTIDTASNQKVINFPEPDDKSKIDFRYPLIVPYAYAHISWDEMQNELAYNVEEPILDPHEREILLKLEQGVREFINMSFISVKQKETLIEFLEKNVRILLKEMNITLEKNSYFKMMYYVYRDFIGLNRIEPLMNDGNIEDIECNGKNSPIYIVHRRYGNIRTNIVFEDFDELRDFVEKLAQKSGRYISYSTPLVDGVLPDGSRLNATFTEDVSSKGPTFTLRKFSKTPWSPVKLMESGSVSAEILAYLWLLVENGSNILVVGGTGSGKCVTGDTPVYLADGGIRKIKDIVEENFKENNVHKSDGWEFVENNSDLRIFSMDRDTLKIVKAKIDKFWRHKSPKELYKIKSRSGRVVTVTAEHPFFSFENGSLVVIRADKLKELDRIAVPRNIPKLNKYNEHNLIDILLDEKDIYVYNSFNLVRDIFNKYKKKYNLTDRGMADKLGVNLFTLRSWLFFNAIPLHILNNLSCDVNINLDNNLLLKTKAGSLPVKVPLINKDLYRFVSLVLGDGHLRKGGVEFCNLDKKLLNEFINLAYDLFGIKSKIEYPKNRTSKIRINSIIISKILNKYFKIPYGKKDDKIMIPSMLFKRDDECIREFLSGMFDCEAYIGKNGIEFSLNSRSAIEGISTLLLRFGIISRLRERKNSFRLFIYGDENIKKFGENIILRQDDKLEKLNTLMNRNLKTIWSNVDLVPGFSEQIRLLRENLDLTQLQFANELGLSRRIIGMWENGIRIPSMVNFSKLVNSIDCDFYPQFKILNESDIFWDQVENIEVIRDHGEEYVYDLTVNEHHNFLAGNIPVIVHNTSLINVIAFFIPPEARIVSIEDSRELRLEHENWLPSVAREGIGSGKDRAGAVTMFDLLKESFRQRPDYVIVGEVRGEEANVLFQGMASGHSSMATMHADDVDTVIRRLETPPINLSPSLVETLDVVCLMTFAKIKGSDKRKLSMIQEVLSVKDNGHAVVNVPFKWDPKTDTFLFKRQSSVFDKIVMKKGVDRRVLDYEFTIRTKLFIELYRRGVTDFSTVQEIVHGYYKNPQKVLREYGLIK